VEMIREKNERQQGRGKRARILRDPGSDKETSGPKGAGTQEKIQWVSGVRGARWETGPKG